MRILHVLSNSPIALIGVGLLMGMLLRPMEFSAAPDVATEQAQVRYRMVILSRVEYADSNRLSRFLSACNPVGMTAAPAQDNLNAGVLILCRR